jgi:hypothetical protein
MRFQQQGKTRFYRREGDNPLIAKLSIVPTSRHASASLALNPLIYFMLAPVNSLAIGECGALWA